MAKDGLRKIEISDEKKGDFQERPIKRSRKILDSMQRWRAESAHSRVVITQA